MKRKSCLKPVKESRILLLLFFSLLIGGCSGKKIPQEVLVKTYVENLIVQEKYSYNLDSLRTHKKRIFDKYKLTQNDFEEALKSKRDDPEAWEEFFKHSNLVLDSLQRNNKIN